MGSRTLKPGELREILTTFKRKGLVTFDQNNSIQVSVDIQIRPTITEVVDGSFLARLEVWGGHSSAAYKDGEELSDGTINDDTDDSEAQSAPVEESAS